MRNNIPAIIDALANSYPEELVDGATKLLAAEAKQYCQRHSGSILERKSFEELLSFSWDSLYKDLESKAPNLLKCISTLVSDKPIIAGEKQYIQLLHSIATVLHARNQESSALQYLCGFLLKHGGCTQRDIERLCKLGVTVSPLSIQNKLASSHHILDCKIMQLKEDWVNQCTQAARYQLVGDNWDKDILLSYRTSEQSTQSLHLFNVLAVVDRVPVVEEEMHPVNEDITISSFLPSLDEQKILEKELVFLVASILIEHIPSLESELKDIYPDHLQHEFSNYAGLKTKQYPLGLYDCDEKKTVDVIQLLQTLQKKYVPMKEDGTFVEPIFFGGDRLTDERIQGAQAAMKNGNTEASRLEGFISKIEDFHRLMNFMEAIYKLTYNTDSSMDQGTMSYYRNLLNSRDVKGKVKNAYRPHKMLYYTVLDAICCAMFLHLEGLNSIQDFTLPADFRNYSTDEQIGWLNSKTQTIVQMFFFEDVEDMMKDVRDIVTDPNHPDNYWVSNKVEDRLQCHHCDKTYACVGSLQIHEANQHQVSRPKKKIVKYKADD
ncbi:uncharacterized protein LOC134230452 [Saccostrea cucullata]|uniref:uncharacterized protein LOC134230452 n=1 Tax=Saccostrea cuccullata TaxID=36930 RepID=UPI002ED5622B